MCILSWAVLSPPCLAWAFCGCGQQGLLSHCRARGSHCGSLSCGRAQSLGNSGFSIWGTSAEVLYGMWNLPGPGIEPVSSAL